MAPASKLHRDMTPSRVDSCRQRRNAVTTALVSCMPLDYPIVVRRGATPSTTQPLVEGTVRSDPWLSSGQS